MRTRLDRVHAEVERIGHRAIEQPVDDLFGSTETGRAVVPNQQRTLFEGQIAVDDRDSKFRLGLGRHRNLFFNCGHGHMGWTMACGTARIVADLMTGRMPEIDLEGLTLRR